MNYNIAFLKPRNRENIATMIRSGQNFGLNTLFIIGGVIGDKYKGNIHKFSHQMDTQDGINNITLLYFETLSDFLNHLPAQTTLVVVETLKEAKNLPDYKHPDNATYLFGTEISGILPEELNQLSSFFERLNKDIPEEYLASHRKTAHLDFLKLDTPKSLNVGICSSIIMYDRYFKTNLV